MYRPRLQSLLAISLLATSMVVMGVSPTSALGTSATVSSLTGPSGSESFADANNQNITVLANGNIVIVDHKFDDGAVADVGAVYLYDGSNFEVLSTIKGTTANDQVGKVIRTLDGSSNFVIVSDFWDNGATADVGAVTWVNGSTGLPQGETARGDRTYVVSTTNSLHGTRFEDLVGTSDGVTALSNGNYVVTTTSWDDGATTNVGAVTWCNGTTGCTGAVSTANSLYGTRSGDPVGGVTALSNGNYVVTTANWDNGATTDVGAVTWCNGTTGCTGVITTANSLHGSTANDRVGYTQVKALEGGNYVVVSEQWDNGAVTNVGAVTWCNGTTGCTGAVTTTNSLHGSTSGDNAGSTGITELTNGNFVVISASWDRPAPTSRTDAGAVTWCSGTSGCTGAISELNSLTASNNSDFIGSKGVVALSNGNYVVSSPDANMSAATYITDAGAVTWCSGTSGCTGVVSSTNSLYGATNNDRAGDGGVVALSNGHYVAQTHLWDNGAVTNVGAVTWCNGTIGCTGAISTSNSLHGSTASDEVGRPGATALTNGNYVVSSDRWDLSGTATNVGAVTWCSGTAGCTGAVTTDNSLHGSTSGDSVGANSSTRASTVTALDNGHYVVFSQRWDLNGTATDVGAITWCNGATGCSGAVTTTNSLHGSTSSDTVGHDLGAITPFTIPDGVQEGNLIVRSPRWDDFNLSPPNTNAGAVTLFNTSTAGPRTVGPITATNSVLGAISSQLFGANTSVLYGLVHDRIYVHNVNNGNVITVISFNTATSPTSSGGTPAAAVTTTTTTTPAPLSTTPMHGSITVAEFSGNSARLTNDLRNQARRALARFPQAKSVECRGFVRTEQLNNQRVVKLARDRARAVCAYLRTLKPSLQTTVVRGSATDGRRRVALTFRS